MLIFMVCAHLLFFFVIYPTYWVLKWVVNRYLELDRQYRREAANREWIIKALIAEGKPEAAEKWRQ